MKKLSILICLFLLCAIAETNAQKVQKTTYQSASVTETAADDGVSIWTGTARNVVQIDKTTNETKLHWNVGGLRDTVVEIIKLSPNGDIWAGTRAGIARFKNGEWQSWELITKAGKLASTITSIAFDSTGGVWVAAGFSGDFLNNYDTTHIIARFNGIQWTSFDKTEWKENLHIENIAVAKDGTIWASGGDVNFTKSIAIRWKNLQMKIFSSDSVGLPPISGMSYMTGLNIDKQGDAWFGTRSGVSHFDGTNWKFYKRFTSSKPVDSLRSGGEKISVDSKGTIWTGGGTGVSRFMDGKWKKFGLTEKIHYEYRAIITEMVIDKNDSVWCLTDGALLCLINDTLLPVTLPPGFLRTEMRGLSLTKDGIILLCGGGSESGDKGVAIRKNGIWEIFRNTKEPIYINDIAVDRVGNLWGTGRRGITRFNGKEWDYWGTSTGQSDTNYAIVADKNNNIWITNDNGVAKFDGSKWTQYDLLDKKRRWEYFKSIAVDSMNNVWVTRSSFDSAGVSYLDGVGYPLAELNRTVIYKYNNQNNLWDTIHAPTERTFGGTGPSALATDPSGNMWLVTSQVYEAARDTTYYPLFRFINNKVDVFDLKNNGADTLRSRVGPTITHDKKGNLWVTYSKLIMPPDKKPDHPGGIASFNGDSWKYEIYDDPNFIDSRSINVDPEGTIWTLTSVKRNQGEYAVVYFKKNGIWEEYTAIDKINRMTFDNAGNAWLLRGVGEIVKISSIYTVGVKEENSLTKNTELLVYPNPAANYIDIHTSLPAGNISIRVHSLLGETVAEQFQHNDNEVFSLRLPIETLAPGVYFVTLKSGEKSVTQMFVKE